MLVAAEIVSPLPTVNAGDCDVENDCEAYSRLYEYEKSEIVFCETKFWPRGNNNGSKFVSEINVSSNVEAKSLDDVSMSAAARRVVPLVTDKDLTSLSSKSMAKLEVPWLTFATKGSAS